MTENQKPENNSVSNTASPKMSIISVVCRICYDRYCGFCSRSCLETWLGESNTTTCELCHQVFRTERTPKYSSANQFGDGVGHHQDPNMVLEVTLLLPEYYNQKKFTSTCCSLDISVTFSYDWNNAYWVLSVGLLSH
ncbi:hypothetical protein NQ318_007593 [Aromia moschata]|uniref:RING-CH-type domain-containing protein n=1 Tax=Aromia moschata TaxID=1265417 RepID=A0AAV8YAG5_9CUCU|nr:hypothetical protein NQ318_007593 [Aromia moschata]